MILPDLGFFFARLILMTREPLEGPLAGSLPEVATLELKRNRLVEVDLPGVEIWPELLAELGGNDLEGRPIGDSPGQYRRAIDSLTTTTGGPSIASTSVIVLPASTGIPRVS